jgi:hypothetical protein
MVAIKPMQSGWACVLFQVAYHALQVIFQHLHITKGNAFPAADGVKAESTTTPVQVLSQDPQV